MKNRNTVFKAVMVEEKSHKKFKVLAAKKGMSFSEYLEFLMQSKIGKTAQSRSV